MHVEAGEAFDEPLGQHRRAAGEHRVHVVLRDDEALRIERALVEKGEDSPHVAVVEALVGQKGEAAVRSRGLAGRCAAGTADGFFLGAQGSQTYSGNTLGAGAQVTLGQTGYVAGATGGTYRLGSNDAVGTIGDELQADEAVLKLVANLGQRIGLHVDDFQRELRMRRGDEAVTGVAGSAAQAWYGESVVEQDAAFKGRLAQGKAHRGGIHVALMELLRGNDMPSWQCVRAGRSGVDDQAGSRTLSQAAHERERCVDLADAGVKNFQTELIEVVVGILLWQCQYQ